MRIAKLMMISCMFALFCGAAEAQVGNVTDKMITNHIERELRTDNFISADSIDVKTAEGVVSFGGTVSSMLAKDRAVSIAEATVGVRGVVNNLQVVPLISRNDSELKNYIQKLIKNNPATKLYKVEVEVKDDGVVNLTGTVDSWQKKQLVKKVVKSAGGVKKINNNIEVDYKVDREDNEIEQEVEQRLRFDVNVDDALIDVTVEDGSVILSGTVGSLQEKRRAMNDSWVAGVHFVDATELDVEYWARDEMRRKEMFDGLDDEEIKEAVKDTFMYDPRLYSFNIEVEVQDGAVTLSGVVSNLQAKRAAQQDARSVFGVRRVINNVKVRPANVPSSQVLKNRVADAFLNDQYIERYSLNITVIEGGVYLSGEVNTSWEKNWAEKVASDVNGVVYVVNNIETEYQWEWKPDWEIVEDVESELFWSPFVDSDDIEISVNSGIVTLTGEVNTFSERQSAEENAFEGGARDVINNIVVDSEDYGPNYYGPYYPYGPYTPYSYTYGNYYYPIPY